jgi:hypothetical protein
MVQMKKSVLILILYLLFGNRTLYGQELDVLGFLKLSLEDQLKAYFDTYRDGHTNFSYPRFASYIVTSYGTAVIPYLKEYVKDADFFSLRKNWPLTENDDFYLKEANEITLELIACIWRSFHIERNPITLQPYTLDENEIQWFIDEYKKRIDEYILVVRKIDRTVMDSERMLYMIACYDTGPEGVIKYGHLYFGIPELYRRGRVLKEYYEQRLGICNLVIDYEVFEE